MSHKTYTFLPIKNSTKFLSISSFILVICLFALCVVSPQNAYGADWPTWRYDAGRRAASPEELPAKLYLQWVRELAKPTPAWPPEQYKLQFDLSYEPVVMGKTIFVPSMVSDKITAYDTDSGKEKWRFYCDGPVRFAPVAWKDKIYFVSDDGYLYCLDAEKGTVIWKFRGGPSERKVLGNNRLISTWPARGAPVLSDGKIYFAASIWPFMGIFIYALDAQTGDVVWSNTGDGSTYITQQHHSPAFAGVAPQGYFAANVNKLFIPSRTIPACYDRKTGEIVYYRPDDRTYGNYLGGYEVSVWKDWFFNNGIMYNVSDGNGVALVVAPVKTDDLLIGFDKDEGLMGFTIQEKPKGVWKMPAQPNVKKLYIKAGSRLYCSDKKNTISAVDVPEPNRPAKISWQGNVDGEIWNMLAADGKLFVITVEGGLYCFGANEAKPTVYKPEKKILPAASNECKKTVEQILQKTNTKEGYCLMLGSGNGETLNEMLHQSNLHIIVLEPNGCKIESLRRELDESGLYGTRLAVLAGDIVSAQMPPYFASLIISEDPTTAGMDKGQIFVEKVFNSLRPYGGTAWLKTDKQKQQTFSEQVEKANLAQAKVENIGEFAALKRVGALPGSADWTHQYGDIANTVCSKDKLVKAPLGLLWFGENARFGEVLPRHAHGPPEQVVDGRLFIEGVKCISARDVYTGRILWKRVLENLNNFDVYYDSDYKPDPFDKSYNQVHIPGANARGTNFVATPEKLYVLQGNECHVLDAETGQTLKIISLPPIEGDSKPQWGYIGVYKDYLIGGAGFVELSKLIPKDNTEERKPEKERAESYEWLKFFNKIASKELVVMNRHTGKVLWKIASRNGLLHNAIAVGNDRIYCLDKLPYYIEQLLEENGIETPKKDYRMLALDVNTGKVLWEKKSNIFGGWLSYSEPYDALLEADRKSDDMIEEAADKLAAYSGKDGNLLWNKKVRYHGPCIIHDKTIITQGEAFELLTGKREMRKHPLTGKLVTWEYERNYGCNTAIASEYLLTFRSAAAGYFDLANDGGTGNIGGFKAGCTSNLVVADGILNAPDYTQTCTCSYQNQTSLALVYMPEAEMWTFSDMKPDNEPKEVRQVGINFGAPGDRKADNGTLWLDYPSTGGRSPDIPVKTVPEKPGWFRKHSSLIGGNDEFKWIAASGGRGIRTVIIPLGNSQDRPYTVRLYFMEPDKKKAGERVFDIFLQGKPVLKNLDIVQETKSSDVGLVKEFTGIMAADSLLVGLTPSETGPNSETIICGIEAVAEGW